MMNRSDMQMHFSHPTFNTATAIEMQKAEEALQKVKKKITDNPTLAQRLLQQFDRRSPEENQYAAWTTTDIQTEVQKLDSEFVKPLLTPENSTSVDEYEFKIEHEIKKTLLKRVITHHTDEKKAHALYLSLKNAHEAKQQLAKGEQERFEEKEKAAEKLWQEAHQTDLQKRAKVVGVPGKDVYHTVKNIVFGEAGPILVKKNVLPYAYEALRKEAKTLQALNHPNIVRAIPTSLTDQKGQISTERTNQNKPSLLMQSGGQPLTLLINGEGDAKEEPLPMKNIQDITRQILSGLAHLHEKGMVHLDIKPDNVLIQADGTVKLIDFGESRSIDDHSNAPEVCGSPLFIAPELINTDVHWQDCSEKCSEVSDIYSTGCLLCQLTTGQAYNHAEMSKGIVVAMKQFMTHAVNKDGLQKKMFDNIDARYPHAHEQPQAEQLKDMLSQMLEPDPANRPSAEALLRHPFFSKGQTG